MINKLFAKFLEVGVLYSIRDEQNNPFLQKKDKYSILEIKNGYVLYYRLYGDEPKKSMEATAFWMFYSRCKA